MPTTTNEAAANKELCVMQGIHIKRHKPIKPGTDDRFTPADFLVGGSFVLYARTFYIVDADNYTRRVSMRSASRLGSMQPKPLMQAFDKTFELSSSEPKQKH